MARLALAGRCWCCYWCWTRGARAGGGRYCCWMVLVLVKLDHGAEPSDVVQRKLSCICIGI